MSIADRPDGSNVPSIGPGTDLPSAEEFMAETVRYESRKAEIEKMSDAYLDELTRITHNEYMLLALEIERRKAKRTTRLVELPCTLQNLETAIHAYGDHNGFHGKIVILPASDAADRNEGIGVEEVPE